LRPRCPTVSFWTRRRHSSKLGVGQFAHVERVGDLYRVGQHEIEGGPIRSRQIQRGPAHLVAPRLASGLEPLRGAFAAAARDDVKELAGADIDDRGGPVLVVEPPQPHEQCLIQTQRGDGADTARVVDQGGAVGDDGVVDGVPVAAKLDGDLVDRAGVAADLLGHPPPGPIRHHQPGRRDARVRPRPRRHRTITVEALPAHLPPAQPGLSTERRQIDQLDRLTVLDHRASPAPQTPRPVPGLLDKHPQGTIGAVLHAQHRHVGQSDKQLADASSVTDHRGSSGL
jgi:hypothetical protein